MKIQQNNSFEISSKTFTIGILSSDQVMEVDKGIGRYNRIFFYEHSSLFIDAVNQLYQQQEKKKSKRKSKS